MKQKLALGTVQFGAQYGINNTKGIPSDKEISEIFDFAFKSGIQILDTAPAYGNAETRIALFSKNRFNVVTKVPLVKNSQELKNSLSSSFSQLSLDSIYGYIFHQADNLINIPSLWGNMQKFKESNKVQKIGYSLYTPQQLEILLGMGFIPDIVQLPYSLLDRKFEKYFIQLKNLGVEIHIRSIFLQGLFFMDLERLPKKLSALKTNLHDLHDICKRSDISIGSLALNFVIDNPSIDHVIIGVDSKTQLLDNISMIENHTNNINRQLIKEINVSNQELLNPANW
jgi:aryl-alcohol dehydrogenase-like predicted oxidoreductase